MPSPLSVDLRERVVSAILEGRPVIKRPPGPASAVMLGKILDHAPVGAVHPL